MNKLTATVKISKTFSSFFSQDARERSFSVLVHEGKVRFDSRLFFHIVIVVTEQAISCQKLEYLMCIPIKKCMSLPRLK